MLKRIAISIMGLLLLASVVLSGYKIFEPTSKDGYDATISSFYINFNNVEEYTLSGGNNTTHYYFFCLPDDTNCKYVHESVIPRITSKNNGIPLDSILEYIDVKDIYKNENFHSKLQSWGISTYPAFVSCTVENGKIVINNTLEFDINNPLNSDDIIDWMILNDIYSGSQQVIMPK